MNGDQGRCRRQNKPYLQRVSNTLAQATLHVGSVNFWSFTVAWTRGGGLDQCWHACIYMQWCRWQHHCCAQTELCHLCCQTSRGQRKSISISQTSHDNKTMKKRHNSICWNGRSPQSIDDGRRCTETRTFCTYVGMSGVVNRLSSSPLQMLWPFGHSVVCHFG